MKTKIAFALAVALILPAITGAEDMAKDKGTADKTMATAPMPVGSEGEVIATLLAVNEHEVRAAQLAQTKGLSPAVMDYANMLETQHGDGQTKTMELSKSTSIAPIESDGVRAMKTKSQTERDELSQLEPAKFEAAYIKAMAKGHEKVLAKLDKELIPTAKNAALVQHLRDTRERVAMHLEKARQLAGEKNVKLD